MYCFILVHVVLNRSLAFSICSASLTAKTRQSKSSEENRAEFRFSNDRCFFYTKRQKMRATHYRLITNVTRESFKRSTLKKKINASEWKGVTSSIRDSLTYRLTADSCRSAAHKANHFGDYSLDIAAAFIPLGVVCSGYEVNTNEKLQFRKLHESKNHSRIFRHG